VRIINIITRISLGAFRQESATQSATNHICGTLGATIKNFAPNGFVYILKEFLPAK
jgi:hypothetical protein